MLCDNCKKNEATILIREIRNGKAVSLNLCAECARKKEEAGELGSLGFNLAEMLFDIGKIAGHRHENADAGAVVSVPDHLAGTVCPHCGTAINDAARAGGTFGCPECYAAFAEWVDAAADKCQSGRVHIGKRPAGVDTGSVPARRLELERLRHRLRGEIRREEYENAAVSRDRIAELEKELLSGER